MNCKWQSKENRNLKCNRYADESGYCIFHKPNKSERENILLEGYIKKGEISDFTGFCFSRVFDINKVIKYDYEKLKFCEAIFEKDANFNDFIFEKAIDFSDVEFKGYVDFRESTFLDNCVFKNTIFNSKYINEQIFEKTRFDGQKLIVERCAYFPRMDGVIFSPYTRFIFKGINYNEANSLCGRNNYKIARIQAKQTEDNENVGTYYYNERIYTSKFLKQKKYDGYKDYVYNNFFDFLAEKLMGYGEKPSKLLLTSAVIISIFALIYMLTGLKTMDYGLVKLNLFNNTYSLEEIVIYYIDSWYFSMITFSTVGFGDITVYGLIGKLFVCIEAFLGITIHATWTSILFNRMIN